MKEKNLQILEVESLEYLTWDFWDKLGHQGHWDNTETESIEDIETLENISNIESSKTPLELIWLILCYDQKILGPGCRFDADLKPNLLKLIPANRLQSDLFTQSQNAK